MDLTQSGNHVYGTYSTPEGQGAIDGLIYGGNIWRGWWHDPLGDGHFIVNFAYDFNGSSLFCVGSRVNLYTHSC
jgi:hypothetical protein